MPDAAAPPLVDSHCHLDFPDFDADRDAVMARARAAGVRRMVTISTRLSRLPRLLALADRNPGTVTVSAGTHPLSAGEEPDLPVDAYVEAARDPRVVAIGEAGLDYFHEGAPAAVQEAVFRRQIEAARRTELPLVIHSRDCDADMIRILTDESGQGAFRFVLHCFSAGAALAERGLELGGFLSFSGILAFKRSEDLRAVAAAAPADRLLVETDAPYLAPPPHRGRRNEPAYVAQTLAVLAETRGLSVADAAQLTTANALALFSRIPPLDGRDAA